jgi:hypothetical protein
MWAHEEQQELAADAIAKVANGNAAVIMKEQY